MRDKANYRPLRSVFVPPKWISPRHRNDQRGPAAIDRPRGVSDLAGARHEGPMHDRIPLIGASARDIEGKARMKSIRGVCRIIPTFDGGPIRRGLHTTWDEIGLDRAVWTIPAGRVTADRSRTGCPQCSTKRDGTGSRQQHRVPVANRIGGRSPAYGEAGA